MTKDERIFRHRQRVLAHAEEIGNAAETCRVFGISRTTFYNWRRKASRYGLDGLRPRDRRRPTQPNETPPWQVEVVLAEAISRPTLGAGRLVEHLEERGIELSPSGVQKVLRRHNLGRQGKRIAALAQITAVTGGQASREAVDGPFGFCHFAAYPGDLLALDTFYVGKLKGVGPVWQFTAVDTATRWAVVQLVCGDKTAEAAAAFVDLVCDRLADRGIEVAALLTDRGPEFTGTGFTDHVAEAGIDHHRTPPASPEHNAVCERLHETLLDEFYRPAFHRQFFTRISHLDRQLQAFVHRYNTRRRNRGKYMNGRTPQEALTAKLEELEAA